MTFISNHFFRNPSIQREPSFSSGGEASGAAPASLSFNNPGSFYSGPFFRSLFLGSLGGAAAAGMQRTVYGAGDAIYGGSSVRLTESAQRMLSESSSSMRFRRFYILAAGPLVEEAIFRGVFRNLQIRGHQRFLGEGENSPAPIVVRTVTNAGLFALLHWHPNPRFCGPRHLATMFATGCVYSALAETTNGIFAPTVAHSLFNLHILRNRIGIR